MADRRISLCCLTGELEKTTGLPIPEPGQTSWIQYEFEKPESIRAITFVTKDPDFITAMVTGMSSTEKTLEASDDGRNYRLIAKLTRSSAPECTISFPAVRAKYFRVAFHRMPPPTLPDWAIGLDPASFGSKQTAKPTQYEIAELVLHAGARVNHWEEKAAFVPAGDLYEFSTPHIDPNDVVAKSDVIDLTSKKSPDGRLDWTPPPGNWVVLRFGYSLLGTTNHPATPEATGLEVDKMDHRFVKNYFENYLDSYKDTVSADEMGKKGIRYVINDSWEAGSQNWTDNMIARRQQGRPCADGRREFPSDRQGSGALVCGDRKV